MDNLTRPPRQLYVGLDGRASSTSFELANGSAFLSHSNRRQIVVLPQVN